MRKLTGNETMNTVKGHWTVYKPLTKETLKVTPKQLPKHIIKMVDDGELDGDFAEWIGDHETEIWDFWYDFVCNKGDMKGYYKDSLDYYAEDVIRDTFKAGEDAMLCGCKYIWVSE